MGAGAYLNDYGPPLFWERGCAEQLCVWFVRRLRHHTLKKVRKHLGRLAPSLGHALAKSGTLILCQRVLARGAHFYPANGYVS